MVKQQFIRMLPIDKGKIVNNLVSISLYLFCIFLFIFMVLCLFWCFSSNLEEYKRNELKQVKRMQNWKKSMKQEDFGQTDRPGWSTVLGRS